MSSKPFGGTGSVVRGSGLIGGTDGQHFKADSHPFEISGTTASRARSKFARMVGLGPNPGGDGDKISANAEMRKKRALNGPGDAR